MFVSKSHQTKPLENATYNSIFYILIILIIFALFIHIRPDPQAEPLEIVTVSTFVVQIPDAKTTASNH